MYRVWMQEGVPPQPQIARRPRYVACTRARARLLVTGVDPGSEFLDDLVSAG